MEGSGSNRRRAKDIYDVLVSYPGVEAQTITDAKLVDMITASLDARDTLWKKAIGEVLKDNPLIAQDFLQALGRTTKALRETLTH